MIYKKFADLVNQHIKLAYDLETEGIQIRTQLKTSKHCVMTNFGYALCVLVNANSC